MDNASSDQPTITQSSTAEAATQEQNKSTEQQQVEDAAEEKQEEPAFLSADLAIINELEDIKKLLIEIIDYLRNETVYDTKHVRGAIKMVSTLYSKKHGLRNQMADVLVDNGFVPIVKSMLKYYNELGLFSTDDVWFPTYYCKNILWNYSDSSVNLCKEMCEQNMISYFNGNLTHPPYLQNSTNKNVSYILKSSLSTLQNMARLVPEAKPLFQKEKTPEILQPFLTWHDEFHKAVAILTLSAIADEEQNQNFEDTGAIPFVVKAMKKAHESSNHRYRGFTPLELLEGLGRLAVNDVNKKKIVEAEALPVLVDLLKSNGVKTRMMAAQVLWTIGFDKESQQKIIETEGCIEALEHMAATEEADSDAKRNAEGTLWKLKGEQQHKKSDTPTLDNHIFISYNHSHQGVILQVKEFLQAQGFKVWIDVEHMAGSMLEAMAWAVENAWVVLVALSENYKQSPNCRQEAEYTFQQKTPIIPLMVQRGYKADGWLGMLIGSKLYINFDGKFDFNHATNMLLQELNKVKKTLPDQPTRGEDDVDTPSHAAIVASSVPQVFAAAPPAGTTAPPVRRSVSHKAREWGKEEVRKWIKKHKLHKVEGLAPMLADMDGGLLVQLQMLRIDAKDVFYDQLTKKLDLDLVSILRVCDALDDLP